MFSTVDYDGALLFPVRIHFQFPARHFSFITMITWYHRLKPWGQNQHCLQKRTVIRTMMFKTEKRGKDRVGNNQLIREVHFDWIVIILYSIISLIPYMFQKCFAGLIYVHLCPIWSMIILKKKSYNLSLSLCTIHLHLMTFFIYLFLQRSTNWFPSGSANFQPGPDPHLAQLESICYCKYKHDNL